MVDFYEMNFMKGIVMLIKEDKIQYLYNILKGLVVAGYWSRDKVNIG